MKNLNNDKSLLNYFNNDLSLLYNNQANEEGKKSYEKLQKQGYSIYYIEGISITDILKINDKKLNVTRQGTYELFDEDDSTKTQLNFNTTTIESIEYNKNKYIIGNVYTFYNIEFECLKIIIKGEDIGGHISYDFYIIFKFNKINDILQGGKRKYKRNISFLSLKI